MSLEDEEVKTPKDECIILLGPPSRDCTDWEAGIYFLGRNLFS